MIYIYFLGDIMKLIFCLDDRNGMMFNGRRQSQDRILRNRISAMTQGHKLIMSRYSTKQFEIYKNVVTNDDFFNIEDCDDYCFIEDMPFSLEGVDEIIIYRWNRHYPADVHFNIDLLKEGFALYSTEDFVGSSHEKITEEKYRKGVNIL